MQISFYNSKSRSKQPFIPKNSNKIGMYVCGPTIYDHPHLGNLRSIVVFDTIFRLLLNKFGSKNISYVRNITDVDDKINLRAQGNNESIQSLTKRTFADFSDACTYVNCLPPSHQPRATQHINEMIDIIQRLINNGFAYQAADHVYFATNKYADYYNLSGRNPAAENHSKKQEDDGKNHPADFVLWKPSLPGDDASAVFASPFGDGRPGWHIECSAMSHKYLGEDFDIHGGGVDLIFPHHSNEVAQSCCAFPGSDFAKYWLHNGFLLVDGEKMSKSLGNFLTKPDLQEKGYSGNAVRLALLSSHYRKPLDFNFRQLDQASEHIKIFHDIIATDADPSLYKMASGKANDNQAEDFCNLSEALLDKISKSDLPGSNDINANKLLVDQALHNDVNTAVAIANLHACVKQYKKSTAAAGKNKIADILLYNLLQLGIAV